MRIYLPSTFPGLAAVLDEGEISGPPLTAYAVTERLAGPDTADDDEELEYEALRGAAAASLRMLSADPSAPRRRAVLAAEAPDAVIGPPPSGSDHPAAVTLTGTVPRKRIAAVHVDAPGAEEAVAAAAAGTGPQDDALEEHELLWYATQELPHLLGRE
ncbi:hypothetical protein LP52_08105 [Streptomonospora alba]|uniref:Uncharacterized protein n=1 Tax=Streptomonospora alba TaxID=183763 RepID=A0A0C2FJ49_9ACTN|nr:hypothetical protein [Streptomonospora alba]KIH99319.1 hypothetical protein LP52_08105 [Streptomonospora alba]